jgi:hypothetical protein
MNAFRGELMLLSWSESSTRGRTVTFLIDEEEDEHPFKKFTIKSGKHAGQRFAAILMQIGEDEQPAPTEQRPSQLAAILCKEPLFQRWAAERSFEHVHDEASARKYLLDGAGIKSRAELDTNRGAQEWFFKTVVQPFNEHRKVVNAPR